jgi:hypothetical protein
MATPADQRLLELLDKWLKSLELHARYSSLDDASYWKIQPWVEHQRPSRWIVDLAMQKTVALRAQVEERMKMGDARYSDSLELMIFLANLVGSEHIERFIPFAEAQNERSLSAPPDDTAPDRASPDRASPDRASPDHAAPGRAAPGHAAPDHAALDPTMPVPTSGATATREMPKFLGGKLAPPPAGTSHVARSERKPAVPAKPAARPAVKHPARLGTTAKSAPPRPAGKAAAKTTPAAPSGHNEPSDVARAQVIADAARLVQWGRKWYELPELIARMADRPSLPEVRRILKENKSAIDAKAGAPSP